MKRKLSTEQQPRYTTARGGSWAIWVKASPTGPRVRVTTWIPAMRDKKGRPHGGAAAGALLTTVAVLWEGATRHFDVVQALCAGQFTLTDLVDRLRQGGIDGATSLFEETRPAVPDPASVIDLVPLVEQWRQSALGRQDGKGTITVKRRLQEVARVLKLVSPELLAWNNACALAARPTKRNVPPKPLPARPDLAPFLLTAFTAERIHEHLCAHYSKEPSAEQREALESAQPNVPKMTKSLLKGQGDGARAAFDAFRVFSRWLIANGALREDPTASLNKPSESEMKVIKLDSLKDVETLAQRMTAPLGDIWSALCGTGLEPSVMLHLPTTHVDVTSTDIIGLGTKNLTRRRRVECSDAAWSAIRRHYEEAVQSKRANLWPSVDAKGRQITRYLLAQEVARVSKELVAEGFKQFRGIHPYSGRHTFVVMAIEGGATAKEIADQLGHRDETMILRRYKLWLPKHGRIRTALRTQQGAKAEPDT